MKLILITLLFAAQSYAGEIAVMTYNVGQLQPHNINFVPCVQERRLAIIEQLFESPNSPLYQRPQAVLGLQEVWTRRAFESFRNAAVRKGFAVLPVAYDDIKNNGIMIVTNLPVVGGEYLPFSEDRLVSRGIRTVLVQTLEGEQVLVANTHTLYSDSHQFFPMHQAHFNEVGAFLDRARSEYSKVVIMGDFNAGPTMSYIGQEYDPAKTIWEEFLIPLMSRRGFQVSVPKDGHSWDTRNRMVSNTTLPIKLLNGFSYGVWGWEELTATLDHVFVSENIQIRSSEVVMDQRVDLRNSCWGRGRTSNMSDHFGVLNVLEL